MSTLLQDLRFAVRMLAKSPGATMIIVLTLAVGLAVNVSVFSFVSDFFLRPLPVRDPEQLVLVLRKIPKRQLPSRLSYPDYLDFRRSIEDLGQQRPAVAKAFSGVMAYKDVLVHLGAPGRASDRMWLHAVSDNYFTLLGVQPSHGRLFLPGEGRMPGGDPIIVLTHEFWRKRFLADPRVVGQKVSLNGLPFTVVGVARTGFHGASWGTALGGFVPATMIGEIVPSERSLLSGRGEHAFFVMGRLAAGTNLSQAAVAANDVITRLQRDYPDHHVPGEAVVIRERMSRPSPQVASFTPAVLAALMMLALLVLAVATANATSLLSARAAGRGRELAGWRALGASRWRMTRQLLTESVLLACGAGIVGMIAARSVTPGLAALLPGEMPPYADTGGDWRLFGFTLGASLLIGIVAAILPALAATRIGMLSRLEGDIRTAGGSRHSLRTALVVGQVSVACTVLVCAGLAVGSLERLSRVNLGFRSDHLLLASFDVEMGRYGRERGEQFQAQLLERVRALPGVREASLAQHAPFEVGAGTRGDISAEGRSITDPSQRVATYWQAVDHDFLKTLGIPVVDGRDLARRDGSTAPYVAVVSRAAARHFWPGENPIGKRLLGGAGPAEVVGLIGDVRFLSMTDQPRPAVFVPLAQNYRGSLTLLVRTERDPASVMSAVQQVGRQLDPDLPIFNMRTMEQQIAGSPLALMPVRMGATVAGAQGIIALFLAGLGIFGLVSYGVSRRTREIGIRMALGATVTDVIRLVSHPSLVLAVGGLAIGLLLSLVVTQAIAGLLYGISTTDIRVIGGVIAIILAVTVVACWLPARRAARVDPAIALRCE
jgi:predicted permease